MPLENFGERLKEAMGRRGLSQTDVARAVSITQPTVWRLLNVPGAKPSTEVYLSLVRAYPELEAEAPAP